MVVGTGSVLVAVLWFKGVQIGVMVGGGGGTCRGRVLMVVVSSCGWW
jgi:hypothetical protein